MSYPRNLQYLAKRIQGYSRATKRLSTLNATTATPGGVITVDLPSNSLIDCHTLVMSFAAASTGAALPRNIESLIQRVDLEVNGSVISGCSWHNQLFNMLIDTSMGTDCHNRRRILQNGADVVDGTATPATRFAITNWLTLNSFSPQILDTKLLGQVRLRITLDGPGCLAGAAGGSFTLSDISFSIDVLSIDDGLFDAAHAAYLQGGGVYELAFRNYLSYSGAASSWSQSTKFSVSSQSLNRVWATFINQTPTGAIDSTIANSDYFVRNGTGLANCQFSINGTYFPDYRASPDQCFFLTMSSYNMLQDVLGGVSPKMTSYTTYKDKMFAVSTKFCHDDPDFPFSGLDTRGNSSIGSFDSQAVTGPQGTANLTTLVFLETSSMLRVGAGRQIELVL